MNSTSRQQIVNVRNNVVNHFKVTRTRFAEMNAREKKTLYERIQKEYPGVDIFRIEELVTTAMKPKI